MWPKYKKNWTDYRRASTWYHLWGLVIFWMVIGKKSSDTAQTFKK